MRDASHLARLGHRALSLRGDAVPVKRRSERVLRLPRNENAFMTTKTWSRRWLFAGFIATVLLALWAVMSRSDSPSPSPMTAAQQNYSQSINDLFGHGTHISSIIASSGVATTGNYQ